MMRGFLAWIPLSLLLLTKKSVDAAGLRFLNGQHGNVACSMEDLATYCSDYAVVMENLVAECNGLHGIHAAKCYMEYLCEHHNQEAVDNHKSCIDMECPLAKRVPTLNCDEFLQATDTPSEGVPTTDASEETQSETEPEPAESEPAESEPAETEPVETETEPETTTEEEESPAEEPEEVELIQSPEVEVEKPQQQQQQQPESSGGGGLSTASKVFLSFTIILAVAIAAYLFRDRIFGAKENYPFDTHIQAGRATNLHNPNAQYT